MDILAILAMVAIFYFLIIRPENKRKKKAEEMRSTLKKGERITTIGGVVGKVVQVNDETIVIETSEDRVRMEFMKWAVQSTESMEKAAAQKAQKPAKAKVEEEKKTEEPKKELENPAEIK